MGMYTEFHFNVELDGNKLDDKTKTILDYMFNNSNEEDEEPDVKGIHPLFNSPRWSWFVNSASYYFAAKPSSSFSKEEFSISDSYTINIRCDLKNYENEIENFINWIEPFIEYKDEMLGFSRYEDTDIMDIYYINPEGKIETKPFNFRN